MLRPLALLGMPKLMEDRDAAQPSKLPVVNDVIWPVIKSAKGTP